MVCYSLLDSKVIGKIYVKLPFDIRESQIKDWQGNKPTKQHICKLIWQTNWFFLKMQ